MVHRPVLVACGSVDISADLTGLAKKQPWLSSNHGLVVKMLEFHAQNPGSSPTITH